MSYIDTIEGLHEIHITVNPHDLFGLRMYCLDAKVKPILAISEYGDFPIQAMFSRFKKGTAAEIIKLAKEMAEEMHSKYNITVVRVKVESLIHNEGVPVLENNETDPQYYFEFHVKVVINNSADWHNLAKACKLVNAHLSFNAAKKETIPLVTLRIPACLGKNKALELRTGLLDHLNTNNFVVYGSVQCEFSVFDSNINLDKGWLTNYILK